VRLKLHHLALGCLIVLLAGLWPAEAEAQYYYRGYPRRVFVAAGFYYPSFYYPVGFGFGWGYPFWYPWGYYGPYPYSPYWFDDSADVRIQVSPRDAEVYVDGRLAGHVDSFDGVFQRLRVQPGGREIVIYHEKYRPITERLYLSPRAGYKIERAMEPLGTGESVPPRPVPSTETPERGETPAGYPRGGYARGGTPMPDRFGTLSLRVQPADAEVLVDGEPWTFPQGSDRFELQLGEGLHRLEVRKEGHEPYTTELRVRTGETLTLNVSLPRR
jgi:PEGA domain